MARLRILSLLLLSSALLVGCSKDADFDLVYDVPLEYEAFVQSFIQEAAIRGYSIEIKNLIINYDETIEAPHCAKCNSNSSNKFVQKVVSINPNLRCWYTIEQHEALIFHELGHCILGRLHDDSKLPNGDLKSLMNRNDLGIYSSCVYAVDNEPCDLTFKRQYYLDELFNEKTPVPDWGK